VFITQWVAISKTYSESLRARRSEYRKPVRARKSARPDRPLSLIDFLYNGYRVFPRDKERPGEKLTHHAHLVLWSRKSRVVRLIPLSTVQTVQSLSARKTVHIIFTYTSRYSMGRIAYTEPQ